MAPSAVPFGDWPAPREMTRDDIETVVLQFADAARRSLEAGFEVVELHMAHGYLLHEFLSPLSNRREDEFGGSLENRARFPLAVAAAVRVVWPDGLPLFARWLQERGVDLVDCSTGGLVPGAQIPVAPGYQVGFAERIRREAGVATGAVGLITEPEQAEEIIAAGKADVVFLARAELRDPYWPLHAAKRLGAPAPWPVQYGRAAD
jgi:2,4-dienoyl-CoA reductase-like NADH-dependent reductase (Old Yellow Enzyme family)